MIKSVAFICIAAIACTRSSPSQGDRGRATEAPAVKPLAPVAIDAAMEIDATAIDAAVPIDAAVAIDATVAIDAPAKTEKCSSNQDCRAYSNYCEGCGCVALGATALAPSCPGFPVSCVVDPCFQNKAVCRGGHCVLVRK